LSLWAALKGHEVTCSDLFSPKDLASSLHEKYQVVNKVYYEALDVTDLPYENHFDIIFLKSILSSIGSNDRKDLQLKAIREIYKSLKPGGKLLFAENLSATSVHNIGRRIFVKWSKSLRYSSKKEIMEYLSEFKNIETRKIGFLGALGRNEKQRSYLGRIDKIFQKVIPNSWKYLIIGVAEK
jgi:SAM-dependent methyltransferase